MVGGGVVIPCPKGGSVVPIGPPGVGALVGASVTVSAEGGFAVVEGVSSQKPNP